MCAYKDKLATCKDRVLWGASREFKGRGNACDLAHGLVLEQCPSCAMCLLKETGCSASAQAESALPFECHVGLAGWKRSWPAAKQHWCCLHRGVGCTQSVPQEEAHDCSGDDVSSWPESKASWCCEEKHIGCSPQGAYDCRADAAVWQSWSKDHQEWCFKHSGFADLHECVAEPDWKSSWSEGKMAWCCRYDSRWWGDKKEWCCQHQGVACDSVYHEISAKFNTWHQWTSFATRFPALASLAAALVGAGLSALAAHRLLGGRGGAGALAAPGQGGRHPAYA